MLLSHPGADTSGWLVTFDQQDVLCSRFSTGLVSWIDEFLSSPDFVSGLVLTGLGFGWTALVAIAWIDDTGSRRAAASLWRCNVA